MKKVLVVVPDLEIGGVTSAVISFCNELVKQGNVVHFLNMGKPNPSLINSFSSDVVFCSLSSIAALWNLQIGDIITADLGRKIALLPLGVIKKRMNRKGRWYPLVFGRFQIVDRYDVAIAYKQCAPCFYFVLNCVQSFKKVCFIHGTIDFMGDISTWDKYLFQFDGIACVSNAVKDGFIKAYPKLKPKLLTVYNMIDRQAILEAANKSPYIPTDNTRYVFLTVARVENASKRIERIPETCSKLVKRGFRDFHWIVVGEGPDLDRNIKYAEQLEVSQFISFCGGKENPYPYFKNASCFILTSEYEAYPIVVLEALVLGVPVIAMEYPAVNEILRNGVNGFIVKQDVDKLSELLESLMKNDTELNRLKENLKKIHVSNELSYRQFEELCQLRSNDEE